MESHERPALAARRSERGSPMQPTTSQMDLFSYSATAPVIVQPVATP
ncbi:hypothetical protein Hgul01_04825 [Herpetosiphon gulosus]|uniref:Uncharacterized protein n=1 Tax=Herpetosiphon gulosus TaxID=1973496 RepID=A0ABP9X6J6_9CHLR